MTEREIYEKHDSLCDPMNYVIEHCRGKKKKKSIDLI